MRKAYFRPGLFDFLHDLASHNDRAWFQAHQDRYEAEVKGPLLRFIGDFGPALRGISARFLADPRGELGRRSGQWHHHFHETGRNHGDC